MNRIYHDLAGGFHETEGSSEQDQPLAVSLTIAIVSASVIAFIFGSILARNPRLGRAFEFPVAILGSMIITISFHVIRILGPNANLRRFHRNWAEWRLAAVSPSRVLWAMTRRGVLWGSVLAVFLISAILTSLAPYNVKGSGSVRLWIILFPGFIDIVFMLVGGVFLDVAQWPKRHYLFRRIVAQFVFGLCGSVPFTVGLFVLLLSSPMPTTDPMPFVFLMSVVSSVIRLVYIGHQWDSAVRILNDEIAQPFR